AVRWVPSSTTWLLVSATPLAVSTMAVAAAGTFWNAMTVLMSTSPGITLLATARASTVLAPGDALGFGCGIWAVEMPVAELVAAGPWCRARAVPAPVAAARAATSTYVSARRPRRRRGG